MSARNRGGDNTSDGELVPLGVLVAALIFGGYVVWNRPFGDSTGYVWWAILGLSILGVLYVSIGFWTVCKSDGFLVAANWIASGHRNEDSRGRDSSSQVGKTPPPSENLKNELYFERANRKCEWCDERVDSPDIHHIKPRSEGGSNDPHNLIVLCPNCHRKADGGTISRSKLKYQVDKRMSN